jgi:hypothetical protein
VVRGGGGACVCVAGGVGLGAGGGVDGGVVDTAVGIADEAAMGGEAPATEESVEGVDPRDDAEAGRDVVPPAPPATRVAEVVVVPCPVAVLSKDPPRIATKIRVVHAVARLPRDTEPNHQLRRLIVGNATSTAATIEHKPNNIMPGSVVEMPPITTMSPKSPRNAETRMRTILRTVALVLLGGEGFLLGGHDCIRGSLACLAAPHRPPFSPTPIAD